MPVSCFSATRCGRVLLPLLAVAALSACGGARKDNGSPGGAVTVSGKITFDRIGFKTAPLTGLNPTSPVESPARNVVVEVLDATTNAILATTSTDASGDYSLQVPPSRTVKVRAKAQMTKTGAPSWDFRVLNNTNADALYVLDGSSFDSGTANSTRNLRATSGWGTTDYTGVRAAAPFAILDTVYRAKELILTASSNATLPPLNLYWSEDNRTSLGPLCPDNGNVGTSFYISAGQPDGCLQGVTIPAGIYILGAFGGGAGDTDEFDQHVIAHEFGHYFEDMFSRSDSFGGDHSVGDRLDLRVAFGEGWGNAYSAMTLNDPVYRDSQVGIGDETGFNLETDASGSNNPEGWFSEASIGEILWDVFDGANEPADTVALGFPPVFTVMRTGQTDTDALTSIFSFATALRNANAAASAGITTLLTNEAISGTDAFASGETNSGGDASTLPVYADITLGAAPTPVCVSGQFGSDNKLGYSKFFRFVNASQRTVVVTAQGAANGPATVPATNPDIYVFRRGETSVQGVSDDDSMEQTAQTVLPMATYVIEVLDFNAIASDPTRRCMTVSVTGL